MNKFLDNRMTIYEYGNPTADVVLIQLVGDHDLHDIENEITEIDQQSLFTLADYFNVSVDYLLGRDNASFSEEKPQLHIPDKYKDVLVAFEGGADDLTQEDVDKVIEYIELLRTKNRSKK